MEQILKDQFNALLKALGVTPPSEITEDYLKGFEATKVVGSVFSEAEKATIAKFKDSAKATESESFARGAKAAYTKVQKEIASTFGIDIDIDAIDEKERIPTLLATAKDAKLNTDEAKILAQKNKEVIAELKKAQKEIESFPTKLQEATAAILKKNETEKAVAKKLKEYRETNNWLDSKTANISINVEMGKFNWEVADDGTIYAKDANGNSVFNPNNPQQLLTQDLYLQQMEVDLDLKRNAPNPPNTTYTPPKDANGNEIDDDYAKWARKNIEQAQ